MHHKGGTQRYIRIQEFPIFYLANVKKQMLFSFKDIVQLIHL